MLIEAFVRLRNSEKVPLIAKVLAEAYIGRWKSEFCKHFKGYRGRGMECEAFPDGIPDGKNLFDYSDNSDCANGIRFEDSD